MPTIEDASMNEMIKPKRLSPRQRVLEEYKGYVNQLSSPEMVKKMAPLQDEKLATLRNRLRRAAQALGKEIEIKKSGNVLFYRLKG